MRLALRTCRGSRSDQGQNDGLDFLRHIIDEQTVERKPKRSPFDGACRPDAAQKDGPSSLANPSKSSSLRLISCAVAIARSIRVKRRCSRA